MNRRGAALLLVLLMLSGAVLWGQYLRTAPVQKHIQAGTQFLQEGEHARAESEWLQAVRLAPDNAEAWDLLGDFYIASGNWLAAQGALQRVLNIAPDTSALQTRLALCAVKRGDDAAARTHAEAALNRQSDDAQAVKLLAEIAARAGLRDEQEKHLRRLVELQPHDADALIALADELARRADYEEALRFIERALVERPDFAEAYFLRGLILFSDNPSPEQLRKAQSDFQKVLELKPEHSKAHRHLGRVYMRLNQPLRAISHFEAVGRGRPYATAHLLELSNAYRKVGKTQKADELRTLFNALKQENRQITDVATRLSQNLDSFMDNLELGRLLLKALNSSPASYHLYAYRHANRELAAVEVYAVKALQLRPHDPQAKALMRQVEQSYLQRLQAGQKEMARKNYQKAQWHLNHAALLRPSDTRTQSALQQLQYNALPSATP